MTIEQQYAAAILPITEQERDRAALYESMFKFAANNLPDASTEDWMPKPPNDWDKAKASLLAHAGISKYIRVVASLAAQEQLFHLQKFEMMRPATFLDEVAAEMKLCKDVATLQLLKLKIELHIASAKASPGLRAVLWDDARVYRNNVRFGVKSLLGYCKIVVSEWLEQIPAENFRELLAELERLESATLTSQLRWFGLADVGLDF